MPPKKWSRQEEEKKLKDRMTDIQAESSDLAKLSKQRQDALQNEIPGIHRQQENDVLQSAEDWRKYYDDDTAWLEQKATLEAQQLVETNEALRKLEFEHEALRVQLDQLKVVKKEPDVDSSEWVTIHKLHDSMLRHPKLVTAFFDEPFMAKLKETFEAKWSDFDQRIEDLEGSVYDAFHDAQDEVKKFLENDFNPRLGRAMQDLRTAHTETLEKNELLESHCEEVKVRLDKREEELVESQAEHMRALKRIEELESKSAQDRVLFEEREEELVNSQAAHTKALNKIKELESQCAQDKLLFEEHEELVNDLETKLAEEKNKLRDVKGRATRYSSEIAGLEIRLDEETKKLEKAMLHRETDAEYSLLARLDLTKTPAISALPIEELKAIVTRAAGFTQSTSHAAARILDSTNTALPEGKQLIADENPNVFILISASGKVEIFDRADIQCVEYDIFSNIRLILNHQSLLLCGNPRNVEKERICCDWLDRYAQGVVSTIVEAG